MKLNCDRNLTKIGLLHENSNWNVNDCSQSQFFEILIPTKREKMNGTKRITLMNQTMEINGDNRIELVFEVVLLGIIGSLGVLGNTAAIIMFFKKKDKVNFHRILTMLIIFDNCLIIFNIIIFIIPHLNADYRMKTYAYVAPMIIPLAQINVTGSIYSTVIISIERYMISCKPFFVVSHKWSAKRYIIPTIIFSVIYNLPKFCELKTGNTIEVETNSTQYIVEGTNLRLNYAYFLTYTIWINFIFMGVIPFTIITILNSLTVHQVIKQMQYIRGPRTSDRNQRIPDAKKLENSKIPFIAKTIIRIDCTKIKSPSQIDELNELQLTITSTAISMVFIICHGIRWIPNIFELIQVSHPYFKEDNFLWPLWVENTSIISHFLITLNSSINFYIYYASRLQEIGKCCQIYSNSSNQEIDQITSVSRVQ